MKSILLIAAALIVTSCAVKQQTPSTFVADTLTRAEIAAGRLTPEVMWKLTRVGSASLSPDATRLLYTATQYSMAQNRGWTQICVAEVDHIDKFEVWTPAEGNSPSWSGDGRSIYFLSASSGSMQLWRMGVRESGPLSGEPAVEQLTDIPGGIEGYAVSPDGKKLLWTQRVLVDAHRSADLNEDLDKSKALIYDGLMVRHWDRWEDGTRSHIFVADMGKRITEGKDIMLGEPWDAPMEPYFDMGEIAWNNTSTQIAYTCKKLTGTEYALSTDSDIFLYDLTAGLTRNLTEGMTGYDRYPRFSPDDKQIAFTSMRRAGNESDKDRLMLLDLATGAKKELTEGFDYSAQNAVWENDRSLLFISAMQGTLGLLRASIEGGISVVHQGNYDIDAFTAANGKIIAQIASLSAPAEFFAIENGERHPFSNVNGSILRHITMGEVEKRMIPTTDGKEMLTWVVYPPDFDPAKKYPVLLYCQGGPQSVVSQFWSYRWNPQLMAAQGYVVVAPNRRGTPSFGQEWLDQISGDYSGQNIRDYLSATDAVAAEPWADKERLGCVGASYGGYSTFYLAGNHRGRFKAFIAHCGMFNFESKYGSTEELWFPNNDLGGPYWSDDPVARRSFANSPHRFVRNWDTPILIITGANDFRIPYTESLQAFTAAQLMGVPSRLVVFEDEAHQVFKPQNSLLWNREFFGWLEKYLK